MIAAQPMKCLFQRSSDILVFEGFALLVSHQEILSHTSRTGDSETMIFVIHQFSDGDLTPDIKKQSVSFRL